MLVLDPNSKAVQKSKIKTNLPFVVWNLVMKFYQVQPTKSQIIARKTKCLQKTTTLSPNKEQLQICGHIKNCLHAFRKLTLMIDSFLEQIVMLNISIDYNSFILVLTSMRLKDYFF